MIYKSHSNLLDNITKNILKNDYPQAILLIGESGGGVETITSEIIQSVLPGWEHGKMDSRFYEIYPEEKKNEKKQTKTISVDDVRKIVKRVTLSSSDWKVVLVQAAGRMTNAAVNSFLKTLEEPTKKTLVICSVNKASELPATILSRCQLYRIPLPSPEESLQTIQIIPEDDRTTFLSIADYNPGLANELYSSGGNEIYCKIDTVFTSLKKGRKDQKKIAEIAGFAKEKYDIIERITLWELGRLIKISVLKNTDQAERLTQKWNDISKIFQHGREYNLDLGTSVTEAFNQI